MRGWISLLIMALLGSASLAQVPQLLSYQGKLYDDSGTPAPDGPYAMEFRFYDACSGGNLLLSDTHVAVETRDGIYAVLLGGGTLTAGMEPDLLAVFNNHDLVCLGVTVEDDTEMVPRQQIVSSGFALRSAVADSASTWSNVVSADDDVVWSGVHSFDTTVNLADGGSLAWPHVTGAPPPQSFFRVTKFNALPAGQSSHPNSESDEQWMVCYNCLEGSTFREDLTQHAWNQKIETNYWDGVTESLEYNWNFTSEAGLKWRPFAFRLFMDGQCSNDATFCTDDADCGAGNSCDGANRATFSWNSRPGNSVADLEVAHGSGRVRFGRGMEGFVTHTGTISGTSVLTTFQLQSSVESENTSNGPVVAAISLENSFASTTDDAQLSDMMGVRSRNYFSGAAAGRDITGQMIAFDAWNTVDQTGGGSPTIGRAIGFRYRLDATGQNLTINESAGMRIETPTSLEESSPVSLGRHFGIQIMDQSGLGTIEGDALLVEAQDINPNPSRGNLSLEGGGWEDGHLRFGTGHLWLDPGAGSLRFKNGVPVGEADGAPLHSPPGTDSNWGGLYWGDSASSAHDSGDEVCALAGLACKESYDMGSATPLSCASSSHATPSFLVLCH